MSYYGFTGYRFRIKDLKINWEKMGITNTEYNDKKSIKIDWGGRIDNCENTSIEDYIIVDNEICEKDKNGFYKPKVWWDDWKRKSDIFWDFFESPGYDCITEKGEDIEYNKFYLEYGLIVEDGKVEVLDRWRELSNGNFKRIESGFSKRMCHYDNVNSPYHQRDEDTETENEIRDILNRMTNKEYLKLSNPVREWLGYEDYNSYDDCYENLYRVLEPILLEWDKRRICE